MTSKLQAIKRKFSNSHKKAKNLTSRSSPEEKPIPAVIQPPFIHDTDIEIIEDVSKKDFTSIGGSEGVASVSESVAHCHLETDSDFDGYCSPDESVGFMTPVVKHGQILNFDSPMLKSENRNLKRFARGKSAKANLVPISNLESQLQEKDEIIKSLLDNLQHLEKKHYYLEMENLSMRKMQKIYQKQIHNLVDLCDLENQTSHVLMRDQVVSQISLLSSSNLLNQNLGSSLMKHPSTVKVLLPRNDRSQTEVTTTSDSSFSNFNSLRSRASNLTDLTKVTKDESFSSFDSSNSSILSHSKQKLFKNLSFKMARKTTVKKL